jgi:hypothetical protein
MIHSVTSSVVGDRHRDGGGKEEWSCPFESLIIPETELQTSDMAEDNIPVSHLLKRQKEATVTETFVGMKVAKQFELGLFVGAITAVTGKKGRFLYTVLYEDGDGEDMTDRGRVQRG